jgi:hypothetical protein
MHTTRTRARSRSRSATTRAIPARMQCWAARRSCCRQGATTNGWTARARRTSSGQRVRLPASTLQRGRLGIEDDGDPIEQRPQLGRVSGNPLAFLLGFVKVLAPVGRQFEHESDSFVSQAVEQFRLGADGQQPQHFCGVAWTLLIPSDEHHADGGQGRASGLNCWSEGHQHIPPNMISKITRTPSSTAAQSDSRDRSSSCAPP